MGSVDLWNSIYHFISEYKTATLSSEFSGYVNTFDTKMHFSKKVVLTHLQVKNVPTCEYKTSNDLATDGPIFVNLVSKDT